MAKKKSSAGGIIIILLLLIILAGYVAFNYINNRVLMSSQLSPGNTAGNLYNLGLFCENGGKIYFSNYMDDGQLYSMNPDLTGFKRLYEDIVRYINADENYLFYSRMNNLKEEKAQTIFVFYSNGLYRIKKTGKGLKLLYSEPIGSVVLSHNRLIYQNYDNKKGLSVRSMSIDGSSDTELFSDDSIAVSVYGDSLYYGGLLKDHSLHSVDLASATDDIVADGSFYMPVVDSSGVYYIDTSDRYSIHRCRPDGSDDICLVNVPCSTYNVSDDGRFIFYQHDENENSGMEVYDSISKERKLLMPGNYKWINIAGGYCFFYSFDETTVYCYSISDGSLGVFAPPSGK